MITCCVWRYIILKRMDYYGRTNLVYHKEKKQIFIMKPATCAEVHIYKQIEGLPFVLDSFVEKKRLFLEFHATGMTLREWVDHGQTEMDRIDVLRSMLSAYSLLHQKGVYHVDIKPDNILVYPVNRVKIIDFDRSFHKGMESFHPGWTLPYYDPFTNTKKKTTHWEKWDLYLIGLLIMFIILERDYDMSDPEYVCRCDHKYDKNKELWYFIDYTQDVLRRYNLPVNLMNLLNRCPDKRHPLLDVTDGPMYYWECPVVPDTEGIGELGPDV